MIRTLATFATVTISGVACGQSINVDFGDAASVPGAEYAAAGLPGVWNVVGGNASPQELVGLDGAPIKAIISISDFLAIEAISANDENTTGGDELLLDDCLPGAGDVAYTVSFSGLEDGEYQVISYAWTPSAPEDFSAVFINESYDDGQIVGGPWPGKLMQGVTHAVNNVEVVDGTMSIMLVGAYWWTSGAFNGVQIIKAEPVMADLNGDSAVNVGDLLILLSHWTEGHGCDGVVECQGDLNHDTYINVSDLLLMLSVWES